MDSISTKPAVADTAKATTFPAVASDYKSVVGAPVGPHTAQAPLQRVEPLQHVVRHEETVQVPQGRGENGTPSTISKVTYTCNHCGKKYKHRNCLVKHLWEHHESWELCLKFNLTKHQQVQMMEAAQILVDIACIKQH